MGCCLLALNAVRAAITRYIAVEKDDIARVVCDNVNDGSDGGIMADHSWSSDVYDITEDKVKSLGPGNIKHVSFGPPCKDHSKLRNVPRKGFPAHDLDSRENMGESSCKFYWSFSG